MQFKKYTKQRNGSIQGLRSIKDTLPKNIKKVINKRGQIFSEILNNWKYIAGENLFKVSYPKSYKNSNKFSVSKLVIMVKRGHEVDLEYSKKQIMDKMNGFFGYVVVEKLKFINFDDNKNKSKNDQNYKDENDVTIDKYTDRIYTIKNEKIKKSLIKLAKVFRQK